MTKEITKREQKAPATIKVSTVIKAIAVTLAIVASFIGGFTAKAYDQNRVNYEASQLVTQLKASE